MQTVYSRSLSVSGRGSSLRTFVVLGALLPAWHSMGMDLFRMDSEARAASTNIARSTTSPYASSAMDFQATAYCNSGITRAGVPARVGLVAADPKVLPLGSWIRVDGAPPHEGLYQVMDTGRLVKGKIIDIYIPSLERAIEFGRQQVKVTVIKYAQSKGKPLISMN